MRIGHASISENNNSGRDGKAKAGDQTGKEVCIRSFYKKPWKYLLRCKDANKSELMAKACETLCLNPMIGYDQNNRLTLNNELKKLNYNYNKLNTPCECDCSSFMTVCAQCAGINIPYPNGNAPTTSNMVRIFQETNMFDVITENINLESNLKRGDILVGPPATHTVMVLDNGVNVVNGTRVLLQGMKGEDVRYMQTILINLGYDLGKWGADGEFGKQTSKAVKKFQMDNHLVMDGKVGPKTWEALRKYK